MLKNKDQDQKGDGKSDPKADLKKKILKYDNC